MNRRIKNNKPLAMECNIFSHKNRKMVGKSYQVLRVGLEILASSSSTNERGRTRTKHTPVNGWAG